MNKQHLLLLAALLAVLGSPLADAQEKYALLVGCTTYPHLPQERWLRGPANDVLLMRDLLRDEFQFPDDAEHIRILSEEGTLPNRVNIEQGFEWLAERADAARAADQQCQVVILLSGHGSRQADTSNDPENDLEQDGFDEVFLPRDAQRIQAGSQDIPNAIVDDDLRTWVADIRQRGAFVWLLMDSCHSGTGIRGTSEQVSRKVELLPSEEIERIAAQASAAATGAWQPTSPFELPGDSGGVVAMYAALPNEETFEMPLPPRGTNRKRHGLLTYTVAQVVKQAAVPMSYEELMDRVRDQYRGWGRIYPTPLVEGPNMDQQVLGQEKWPNRSRVRLQIRDGSYTLNVGSLHGVTKGSVAEIKTPPGEVEKVLGYVEVLDTQYTQCDVKPHAFNDLPANRNLPDGGRAELVFIDYGDLRMRVAVDVEEASESGDAGSPPDPELVARIRAQVAARAEAEDVVFRFVEETAEADWLVRVRRDNTAILVPAEGWSLAGVEGGIEKNPQRFGPIPTDNEFGPWLETALRRISKVRNLTKLCSESAAQQNRGWMGGGIELEIEPRRLRSARDFEGLPLERDVNGLNFRDGDLVGFVVHNKSGSRVDITVLFIDSAFRINPAFPRTATVLDNRLEPNSSGMVYRIGVNTETVGLEHMLLIAVKSAGDLPVSFIEFAQPGLQQARGERTRGVGSAVTQGLRGLLEQATFGQGQTRGGNELLFEECCMRLLTWNTVPPEAEAE